MICLVSIQIRSTELSAIFQQVILRTRLIMMRSQLKFVLLLLLQLLFKVTIANVFDDYDAVVHFFAVLVVVTRCKMSLFRWVDCAKSLLGGHHLYMAGITQEVHPYQPNVTKSCSLLSFSRAQFFTKLHGSFYIFPIRGSVPSVVKKINKKVSGKNLNLTLKIGIFYFKIF